MFNGCKAYGVLKRRKTDNQTLTAIQTLRIPSPDNLADVLGISKKQSMKRARRLVKKKIIKTVKINYRVYYHLN